MEKLCDKVVIGSDENRKYLDFWPHVAYAYRTMFPGVQVDLALVTERREDDPLIIELEKHGNVWRVSPVDGYPMASQAKMARFIIAAMHKHAVCFIDDLDEIPIDRDWHLTKTAARQPGSMLLIGREVYGNTYPNQVPASMMAAEGHVFERMFGIDKHENVQAWYEHLYALRVSDTDHTNIKLDTFSDEALIVKLREENPVPETHLVRGYVPGRDTIDRGWWPYSTKKLEAGGYLAAHTARPYGEYKEGNDAIIRYIQKRYEGGPVPKPLAPEPPKGAYLSAEEIMAFASTR